MWLLALLASPSGSGGAQRRRGHPLSHFVTAPTEGEPRLPREHRRDGDSLPLWGRWREAPDEVPIRYGQRLYCNQGARRIVEGPHPPPAVPRLIL